MQRDYAYVGDAQADQDFANKAGQQSFPIVIAWADVPQNIQTALISIDAWTEAQILADEGME
ncbi:MAG: hypothetical protein GY938_27140 [Ketobacter sp.]|nr:hypothetical protein [Ketobacter sp.]